ncbi:MAG: cytochrome c biogenesis protein CcdA [Rhizobiales bacterium]|nr:cytochrome c biogenesis protein CcdA [Hyphomicrobiales bacterium]
MILAFLAGVLSILSPCVLPLLPLTLGAAAAQGKYGPASLALGLAVSFVAVGLFVALVGFSIGLDQGFFRAVAAILLIVVGVVLAVPVFQAQLAVAAGPASSWVNERFGGGSGTGYRGQFGLGLLLGAVWTPCVGPTLGAASVLAAQGENLGQVTLTMLSFGLGAALPLLVIGRLSRDLLQRWRARIMDGGKALKSALGLLLLVTGLLILTGLDKKAEAALVELSPAWLTALTTRF